MFWKKHSKKSVNFKDDKGFHILLLLSDHIIFMIDKLSQWELKY